MLRRGTGSGKYQWLPRWALVVAREEAAVLAALGYRGAQQSGQR